MKCVRRVVAVVLGLVSVVLSVSASPSLVFSDSEMKECKRIRTPNLVHTPGAIILMFRCCGDNLCSSKTAQDTAPPGSYADTPDAPWHSGPVNQLGDDIRDCRVGIKRSYDHGQSWCDFDIVSPSGETGWGNGAGLYLDPHVYFQMQYVPGGSTAPAVNVTTAQVVADKEGNSRSGFHDITEQIRPCSVSIGDMQMQSAGDKVVTSSGRLVWAGHDHGGHACIWYSDTKGASYKTSARLTGNEVSVAIADEHTENLYMNGRPTTDPPHRSDYRSSDGGAKWDGPTKSSLKSDDGNGCERSVRNIGNVLYSSEPVGPKRTQMTLSCSADQGKSWPSTLAVNGDAPGAYSAITDAPNDSLLLVWENNETGNMYFQTFDKDWCKAK